MILQRTIKPTLTPFELNKDDSLLLTLDPAIPFVFYADREADMLAAMREIKRMTGIRHFLLIAPIKTIRVTGLPGDDLYAVIGAQIRRVRETLAPEGFVISWWNDATLKVGPGGPFTLMTGLDGERLDRRRRVGSDDLQPLRRSDRLPQAGHSTGLERRHRGTAGRRRLAFRAPCLAGWCAGGCAAVRAAESPGVAFQKTTPVVVFTVGPSRHSKAGCSSSGPDSCWSPGSNPRRSRDDARVT